MEVAQYNDEEHKYLISKQVHYQNGINKYFANKSTA